MAVAVVPRALVDAGECPVEPVLPLGEQLSSRHAAGAQLTSGKVKGQVQPVSFYEKGVVLPGVVPAFAQHVFLQAGHLMPHQRGHHLKKAAEPAQHRRIGPGRVRAQRAHDAFSGLFLSLPAFLQDHGNAEKGQMAHFLLVALEKPVLEVGVILHAFHNDGLSGGEHLPGDAPARGIGEVGHAGLSLGHGKVKTAVFRVLHHDMGPGEGHVAGNGVKHAQERFPEGKSRAEALHHMAEAFKVGFRQGEGGLGHGSGPQGGDARRVEVEAPRFGRAREGPLQCFFQPFEGLFRVFGRIEGRKARVAFAACAEARARGADHGGLFQHEVEEVP